MKKKIIMLFVIVFSFIFTIQVYACTGVYVGKKVSDTGATIIARTRDSNNMEKGVRRVVNKRIENVPNRKYKEINGFEMVLPDTTYKYISGPTFTATKTGLYGASCINEEGLAITATVTAISNETILSKEPFVKTGISEACIGDIVAMCCKTSREAVLFLGDVIKKYGNAESNVIMIADQNEAWLMETYTGYQWAAVKMPEDKIAVFGNQFMLDPINEEYEEMLCSDDLEKMPKAKGVAKYVNNKFDLFNTYSGKNLLTDYSQTRNWYGMYCFAKNKPDAYDVNTKYQLFYEPNRKIGFLDIKELYRSRYEGTDLCPDIDGREDRRIIGTETQYSVDITEVYDDLPKDMSIVSWVCFDNAEHSVFIPFSNFIDRVYFKMSKDLEEKLKYDDGNTAYYIFQNLCVLGVEGRETYGKGIRAYWDKLEKYLYKNYYNILNDTKKIYENNKQEAMNYLTKYTVYLQNQVLKDAEYMTKEVMHYLALNQRTFNYKTASGESGKMLLSQKYEHPDYVSELEKDIEKIYDIENVKSK